VSQWPAPEVPSEPPGHDPEAEQLVGVSLRDQYRAVEFLSAMRRLNSLGKLELRDAVTVIKDEHDNIRVIETMDPQPGRAALSGAVWTGLLGLIVGGPVGWLAGLGLGAGAGAITAKVVDLGIPDEWVEWFKAAVRPGTYTVVVLARGIDVGALVNEASRFAGASLVHTTLSPDAIARLTEAFGGDRA
jgi:uncharacterized membrane protein